MVTVELPPGLTAEDALAADVIVNYVSADPGMLERLIALRKQVVGGAESYAEALMGSAGHQVCEPLARLCEAIDDLSRVIGYLEMDYQRDRMAKAGRESLLEHLRAQGLPVDAEEQARRLAKQPKHA